MKRRYSCGLMLAWLMFSLVVSSLAAATSDTTLTGQVSNAATQGYLEGAVVQIQGTNRSVMTDREGRYIIPGLAPGEATLVVSFSGLDTQRLVVPVSAGQRVVKDIALTAGIYQMEKFTVAGEREGMAKAEVLQRQAPNVKTVISSDAFGNVADGNIAEMLQQVAGVTTQYNGAEARGISMRGVESALNSVTVDGQSVAQSASAAVDGRRFDFDQQSLGNIESIEITKAPTPDMEGASIGGSVNLVTKSPFDRAGGRVVTYSVGVNTQNYTRFKASKFKELIPGYGQLLSLSYSDLFGAKRNWGATFTFTYANNQLADTTLLKQYETKADPGPAYLNTIGTTFSSVNRTRVATGVNLAYRWSETTTIVLNTAYNWSHKTDDNPRMTLTAPRTLATLNAAGQRTGGGAINPNYADGITRVYAIGNGTNVVLNNITSDNSGGGVVLQPMVRHRFDNGLAIDYSFSFSNSNTAQDSSPDNATGAPPKGTALVTLNNVGWTVDRSTDTIRPTVRQTEGLDWTDLNNYTGLTLTQGRTRLIERIYNGRFDLKKNYEFQYPVYFKTGLNYKKLERNRNSAQKVYSYMGPDKVLGTADDNRDLAQFLDTTSEHLSDKDFQREYHGTGLSAPWPNPYGVAMHQHEHPEFWSENPATSVQNVLQSLRNITETISAAYVMGEVRFGKVSVMSGLRYEETRDEGVGPLNYISPAEAARRLAWSGPVTTAEAVRRAEAQFGNTRTNNGKYDNWFPGIHLKYEPFQNMLVRASWSTGIGRPAFGAVIPLDTANDTNMTVTSSNSNLRPQTADSYDVTAEYYFSPQGLISAGVFKKNIKDYIYTDNSQIIPDGADNGFAGQYGGYRLTTQLNRGTAKIEGLELNYQQQLTFLPGWAKGFGANANYTYLRTEGNYGGTTITNTGLPQFIPKTGNVGISYRGYGLDIRLGATIRSKYLQAVNANPALEQFRKPATIFNLRSKYSLTRKMSLFLDIQNITSQQITDVYYLYEDRSGNFHMNPARYTFGVMGRF